ncbi:MAG: hypothetical protein WC654_07205, partial [Patescibacteria group bacterium]
MTAKLNQTDFGLAARALARELKARLEKGELPVFHPDRIEIISAKRVNVGRLDNPAPNLRECLRKFGATLFHLLTGESEFNHEKYDADPKENYAAIALEEPANEIVRFLLSGQAISMPEVERKIENAFGARQEIRRKFNSFTVAARKAGSALWQFVALICTGAWDWLCYLTGWWRRFKIPWTWL